MAPLWYHGLASQSPWMWPSLASFQGMAGQTCASKGCPAALRKPDSRHSAAVHPTLASADQIASVQMFPWLRQIGAYRKSLHSYSWEGRGIVYVIAHPGRREVKEYPTICIPPSTAFYNKTDPTKNFPGSSSSIGPMGTSFLTGTGKRGLLNYCNVINFIPKET